MNKTRLICFVKYFALSLIATPLVAAVHACFELLKQREIGRFIYCLIWGLLACFVEVAIAFYLALHWSLILCLIVLLAFIHGLINSFLFRNSNRIEGIAEGFSGKSNMSVWILFSIVLLSPMSMLIALIVNPNGFLLIYKPDLFQRSASVNLVIGLLLGLLLGLIAVKNRQNHSSGLLFMFCAAVPLTFLVILASGVAVLSIEKLITSEISGLVQFVPNFKYVFYLELGFGVFLGPLFVFLTLMFGSSIRSLVNRSAFSLLFLIGLSIQTSILDTELVFKSRVNVANEYLGSHHWEKSASVFRMLEIRSPWNHRITNILINWAVNALVSGNEKDWRHILQAASRIPDTYNDYQAIRDMKLMNHRGDTPMMGCHWIDLTPVRTETYLDENWCAFLTIAKKALGIESESQLKYKLKTLSPSTGQISVFPIKNTLDLLIASDAFGLDMVFIPAGNIPRAVELDYPVMYRDATSSGRFFWNVIIGYEPGTQAYLLYSSQFFSAAEAPKLEKERVEALIAADSDNLDSKNEDLFWMLIGIGYHPSLESRLNLMGGWAVIFVPRGESIPDGLNPMEAKVILDQEYAQSACLNKQFAQMMPILDAYEEDWSWTLRRMGALKTKPLIADIVFDSKDRQEAWADLSDLNNLDRLDLGSVMHLSALIPKTIALPDRVSSAIFGKLTELNPMQTFHLENYLKLLSRIGDEQQAGNIARAYLRSNSYQDKALMVTLDALTAMPCKTPELRTTLQHVLDFMPFVLADPDKSGYILRYYWAPYAAARAKLALEPEDRLHWWTRSVELENRNPIYLRELKTCLLELNRTDELESIESRLESFQLEGMPS